MDKASMQEIRHLKERVIQAALDLAAQKNWGDISLRVIAMQAGYEQSDVVGIFEDKEEILTAYMHHVDHQVAEVLSGQSLDEHSEKDRLFDVLMERFDILSMHRKSVLSIINAVTLDPKQAAQLLPSVGRSMTKMLELAHTDIIGMRGILKVSVLTGLWLKVLRDWLNDETTDMAVTMASLDKALGYFEKI